ncbi:MAG: nitroreductase [Nitrospirota bacterium]|jgi:nitroreductase
MELLEGIYSRRSVRRFSAEPVEREQLMEIVTAGTWAPSGLNNQPWRFVLVRDRDVRHRVAGLTRYSRILEDAPSAIAVFVDRETMYHDVKDYQAMGACIQNMLLAAHALGLGAVWLGEILNRAEDVRRLLAVPETMELMAVVAIGHPHPESRSTSSRKELSQVVLGEM